MWVPVHGAPASANTHGEAAAGGGRLPTRVGKEFVQGGFGPASSTLSAGGQFKQGCCKGSLRCDGQDATPPHDPRCPCRSPERGRHFCCTCAGQQADEGCWFRGPPAAYLEPEHNQAAAACPLELRVSLALFAAGGLGNNDAGMGICIGPGLAIPAEGTDERGINCELLPMPQGQPVADNLDALGVLHGHIQVHISQAHIPGHTCASLAAHPGECALKGDGARGKDAGGGTRRSVITKHIKRPAASASPRARLTQVSGWQTCNVRSEFPILTKTCFRPTLQVKSFTEIKNASVPAVQNLLPRHVPVQSRRGPQQSTCWESRTRHLPLSKSVPGTRTSCVLAHGA